LLINIANLAQSNEVKQTSLAPPLFDDGEKGAHVPHFLLRDLNFLLDAFPKKAQNLSTHK
jgi:hypothetical protein